MILNGCLEQAGETTNESLEQTKVKVVRENEKRETRGGRGATEEGLLEEDLDVSLVAGVGVNLGKVLDFLLG